MTFKLVFFMALERQAIHTQVCRSWMYVLAGLFHSTFLVFISAFLSFYKTPLFSNFFFPNCLPPNLYGSQFIFIYLLDIFSKGCFFSTSFLATTNTIYAYKFSCRLWKSFIFFLSVTIFSAAHTADNTGSPWCCC